MRAAKDGCPPMNWWEDVTVGIVARNFPPYVRGGSALSAYHLAKGLADEGLEVHIFTSSSPKKPEEGMMMKMDLKAEIHEIFDSEIPKNALRRDLMSIKMALQLRKKLRGLGVEFDVLHSYGMDTVPAMWFNKKYSRVVVANANENWATCPFVDHVFNDEYCPKCRFKPLLRCVLSKVPGNFLNRLLAFPYFLISIKIKREVTKRLTMLFPISEDMKNRLIQNGFNPQKMQVCYIMVDPKEFEGLDNRFLHRRLGLDESTKILLYAGRFAPYKGVEYIMRAVPKVVNEFDVVFVFLGHGSGKADLIALSRELGVDEKVLFGGFVNPKDMPSAYASSYCVLMPSTWSEPLGRVQIEAMTSGCAVIATDVGGIPEVVINGETGLLIKPFSSEEIANAVMLLLREGEMRNELAKCGMEMVLKKHSMNNQIKNYIGAYKTILGGEK